MKNKKIKKNFEKLIYYHITKNLNPINNKENRQ